MKIIEASGTLVLAIAAFYQIYHTEHKAEKLKPKLIILPEFEKDQYPKKFFFRVYNMGKSVAKSCNIRLKIISTEGILESLESRTISWTWNEYIQLVNSSGESIIENISRFQSKDIFPKEGASTTLLSIWDLLGIDEKSSKSVSKKTIAISVKVYSENMELPATYPMELEWTGKCFNISFEFYQNESKHVQELEDLLNKAAFDEMKKLRILVFFKKRKI